MSQGFEILKAKVKDSAIPLIGRIMRSKQTEIVLILPKNSIIAADLNSLKTLKEEAESIGKILSLNTDNKEIKSFAKTIGIPIYNPNYKKSEKIKSVNIFKKIKVFTDILPPLAKVSEKDVAEKNINEKNDTEILETPESEEPVVYDVLNRNFDLEKNIESFYNSKNGKKNAISLNWIINFFILSGFIIFGFAMYLILPKVNITVSLNKIPLKTQISVAVSKNINSLDLANNIIPGQYFSISKSDSKTLEGSFKIGGVIEVYNAYSTAPQRLVSGTRFETKDGKIFRIQNSVIIPGAKMTGTKLIPSSIKANVMGDEISDDYLIGPSYFTIPGFKKSAKYAGFYAKNSEPMAKMTNISLNNENLQKNKKDFSNKLAQELKINTLNTLKDSDLRLINGASIIKIDDFKINSNVLNMKVTWQALFFKEKDLRTLINYFVSSHFTNFKNFAFNENIVYPEITRVDFKKGELFFTININKDDILPIDIADLKKELVGRNEDEMRTIISDKVYINSAAIYFWPFWVKKAPTNLDRINITIDNK